LLVEQPRTFLGQRARCQTVAFLVGIHRRQPAAVRLRPQGVVATPADWRTVMSSIGRCADGKAL
jgi:hypothetical protein